jgi:hypothetical protein
MDTFDWIMPLIIIPIVVIIPVVLMIVAHYERKQKKSPKLKTKDWIAERSLKGKGEARGYVACSDCGKQLDAAQMTTFQRYRVIALDGAAGGVARYWEEVIPGKKRNNRFIHPVPLSKKLVEVKVLCPSCADRFRYKIEKKLKKTTSC